MVFVKPCFINNFLDSKTGQINYLTLKTKVCV